MFLIVFIFNKFVWVGGGVGEEFFSLDSFVSDGKFSVVCILGCWSVIVCI